MKIAAMFRILAGLILVQIAIGGLVTFGFVGPLPHIVWGAVVFAAVAVTAALTLRSKPADSGLRGVSFGLIVALAAQVVLGLVTLSLESDILAWVHLVLGVLIYAMSLTGMSFAMRQEHTSGRITTSPSG
jgi:heme A synthase